MQLLVSLENTGALGFLQSGEMAMLGDAIRTLRVTFDARKECGLASLSADEEEVDRIAEMVERLEREEDVGKFFLLAVKSHPFVADVIDAGNEPALLGGVMSLSYSSLTVVHFVTNA